MMAMVSDACLSTLYVVSAPVEDREERYYLDGGNSYDDRYSHRLSMAPLSTDTPPLQSEFELNVDYWRLPANPRQIADTASVVMLIQ